MIVIFWILIMWIVIAWWLQSDNTDNDSDNDFTLGRPTDNDLEGYGDYGIYDKKD